MHVTMTEINYLLDLFGEIKDGVDDGVLDEIENAEEMIEGWKQELSIDVHNLEGE